MTDRSMSDRVKSLEANVAGHERQIGELQSLVAGLEFVIHNLSEWVDAPRGSRTEDWKATRS